MSCPVFPKPVKNKASLIKIFFKQRRSWLDALYSRSYKMKMGHVRLPGLNLFMVNQPNLVRRIMVEEVDNFPKNKLLGDILEPLLGKSIFTTNGTVWRKQRDMLDPAFEFAKVEHVFTLMQEAVGDMEKRLEATEHEPWIDIDPEITYVTADIIFRTIMSVKLEPSDAHKVLDAFVRFQAESPKMAILNMFGFPDWLLGNGSKRKRRQAASEIRSTIENIIRPRYQEVTNARATAKAEGTTLTTDDSDLLSTLLLSTDKDSGKPFTFSEIVDQVSMLFLAGHETSASALTWSLYLLALNPKIQEEAHAEVSAVMENGAFNVSVVKRMRFVRDIFKEALRLYPPVGFLTRECAVDTEMRDKKMPKGSAVMISPWLIQRHSDLWEHEHEFDPYRFSRGDLKSPLRDSYLPFGAGPRVCIGAAFAQQEATLILCTLLRKYRFELAPDFVPQPVGRLTIRSENGMRLVLTRRELPDDNV